jgi:hypothetical protein
MAGSERRITASGDRPALATHGVVLILADAHVEIPGYWNLRLDVRDRATRISRTGQVYQRQTLESRARDAFEAERDILTEGNYRISLSGEPAVVDFLEIMRAKLLVSEGQEPIDIVIAEEKEVVDHAPEPGREPQIVERRVVYRRMGHPDEPLPGGMVVFDLSDDGGSDADGAQIPIEIPGARVIGWRGVRNRGQLLHEAYADTAARSLIARAAALGARGSGEWGIYVGRQAQVAVAVLRESRGFYAGRMLPLLVREQWRHDAPGTPPSWRPLGLRLLDQTRVA